MLGELEKGEPVFVDFAGVTYRLDKDMPDADTEDGLSGQALQTTLINPKPLTLNPKP